MIFVSYAQSDREFATKLATDLRSAGCDIWLDQLSIQPGQRWDVAVESALLDSPDFLLVLSPSAVASTNVMDEVTLALDEKKRVIPVLYRQCRIPLRLRRLQYVDFESSYEDALQRLLQSFVPAPFHTGNVNPIDADVQRLGGREALATSPGTDPDQVSAVASEVSVTPPITSVPAVAPDAGSTRSHRPAGRPPSIPRYTAIRGLRKPLALTLCILSLAAAAYVLQRLHDSAQLPSIPPRRVRTNPVRTPMLVPDDWEKVLTESPPERPSKKLPASSGAIGTETVAPPWATQKGPSESALRVRRTRPVPQHQPIPSLKFPENSTCRFNLIVGADGRVADVAVERPCSQHNSAIVTALQTWRFKPATEDGQPVRAPYSVEISFRGESDE